MQNENTRKKILIFIIILSCLPFIILPAIFISTGFFLPGDELWILGSLTGIFGFLLMFWEYVSGVKAIIQIFTKDIVFVNKLHKWLGIYGLVLMLAHPILLFIDFAVNRGINLLFPNSTLTYNLHVILGDIAFLLFFLTWLTSYLIRKRFTYRMWKLIHLFSYFMVPITILHAHDIGTFISEPNTKMYFFFISILMVLLLFYRLGLQFGIFKLKYKVKSIEKLTYDTIKINLEPLSLNRAIVPLHGQFVEVQLSIFGESHPFTVATFDETTKELSLMPKNTGKFSNLLMQLKPGQEILLDGPYGVFMREAYMTETKKIVMIAGGIGITPFLGVVDYINSNPSKFDEAYLFFGNKTESDMMFENDFEYATKNSNLKIINVLSNETKETSAYEKGFITSTLLKKYITGNLADYTFFVCGPPIMMLKLKIDLPANNVSMKNIHMEEFSF